MKILHCADIHVGRGMDLFDHPLKRYTNLLHDIYVTAETQGCRAVLIAGDVFHVHTKSWANLSIEQEMVAKHLLRWDDHMETVIISGNHDLAERNRTMLDYLVPWYKSGRLRNTHILTTPQTCFLADKKIEVMGVPYGFDPDISFQSKSPDVFRVVMRHEAFAGFESTSGWEGPHEMFVGFVPVKGAHYYACGDIHKRQVVKNSGNLAFYCGAPAHHDFGDVGSRGVLIVDSDNPSKPKFVEIGTAGKYQQLVSVTKDQLHTTDPVLHKVRLIETTKDTDLEDLPSHVVSIKHSVSATDTDIADMVKTYEHNILLDGLGGFLQEKGYSKEFISHAHQVAEELSSKL